MRKSRFYIVKGLLLPCERAASVFQKLTFGQPIAILLPGGVVHGHHGCLWATLPGSMSGRSFIPLVTPLRRDDQGLSSAMKPPASPLLRSLRQAFLYTQSVHGDMVMVHCACNRVAVGPFRAGVRAKRATLPDTWQRHLGRRSWSFYVCGECSWVRRLNRRNCLLTLKHKEARATRAI